MPNVVRQNTCEAIIEKFDPDQRQQSSHTSTSYPYVGIPKKKNICSKIKARFNYEKGVRIPNVGIETRRIDCSINSL